MTDDFEDSDTLVVEGEPKSSARVLDAIKLREILTYDPESGDLFWLYRDYSPDMDDRARKIFNAKYAGKKALSHRNAELGYMQGSIFGKRYWAHRVIWALVYGQWPDNEIDHINGDRSDNRLSNLRACIRLENSRNKKRLSVNTSGFKGVSPHKESGKWRATICVNGKQLSLGYFHKKEDAWEAYKAAAYKHFGDFARVA